MSASTAMFSVGSDISHPNLAEDSEDSAREIKDAMDETMRKLEIEEELKEDKDFQTALKRHCSPKMAAEGQLKKDVRMLRQKLDKLKRQGGSSTRLSKAEEKIEAEIENMRANKEKHIQKHIQKHIRKQTNVKTAHAKREKLMREEVDRRHGVEVLDALCSL